jgi:hypothetical protein
VFIIVVVSLSTQYGKFWIHPRKYCGYEVTGMILFCYLKGAMRIDCSNEMSVHVSTCTSYDFKALAPVVGKL